MQCFFQYQKLFCYFFIFNIVQLSTQFLLNALANKNFIPSTIFQAKQQLLQHYSNISGPGAAAHYLPKMKWASGRACRPERSAVGMMLTLQYITATLLFFDTNHLLCFRGKCCKETQPSERRKKARSQIKSSAAPKTQKENESLAEQKNPCAFKKMNCCCSKTKHGWLGRSQLR